MDGSPVVSKIRAQIMVPHPSNVKYFSSPNKKAATSMVHKSLGTFPGIFGSQNALRSVLSAFHKVFGEGVYAVYLGLGAAITSLVRHTLEDNGIHNFPIWVLYGAPSSAKTTLLKTIGAMTGIPHRNIVSGMFGPNRQ